MDPDAQGGPSPSSPTPRPVSARRRPPARRRPVRRAAPPARRGPSQRTSVVVLSALTAVVAAVAVGAFMIGSNGQPGAPASGPTTTTTTQGNAAGGSTLPPAALRTFRDPETGFSVQYPVAWQQLPSSDDPSVRLRAAASGGDGMSVRVQRFEQPTTAENMDNIQAFGRAVVTSNKSAKVLLEQPVTVDGMPGFYYLYTYADSSGQEGAHAHYFLFRGRKANQIVFQAVPSSGFDRLAPLFQQIADSFKSDPE
ncbi:MAG: PsbP-related protein [Acidimicrobiales bacterium]